MNTSLQRIEFVLAVLFFCTTFAGLGGGLVWAPLFEPSNLLPDLVALLGEALGGSLLWLLGCINLVLTSALGYHYLHVASPIAAIAVLVIRCLEASVMLVGILAVLLLVSLCQSLVALGPGSETWTSGTAFLLKQVTVISFSGVSLLLHGLGGLLFLGSVHRRRSVPFAIAGVGFLAYLLCFVGAFGTLLGANSVFRGIPLCFLIGPVLVFEMALVPAWLLRQRNQWR